MMIELGFLRKFVVWVMKYITSVSCIVFVNGNPIKPFNATKGFRHVDPIFPFISAIGIKYLTRMVGELTS